MAIGYRHCTYLDVSKLAMDAPSAASVAAGTMVDVFGTWVDAAAAALDDAVGAGLNAISRHVLASACTC
jgi:hypothetical protein